MRKFSLLTIALILSIKLPSQKKGLFDPVALWGISHPFAAVKIQKINRQCLSIYHQKELKTRLDSFSSGGQLDAFRHVFFMAAFHQKVKAKKLRKLGRAHENKNYRQFLKGETPGEWQHDSLSMVMDLHNNEVAFGLKTDTHSVSLEELKEKVIQSLLSGKALIMKRNRKGQLLKCDNSLLRPEDYGKVWYIPKCLVSSNWVYAD